MSPLSLCWSLASLVMSLFIVRHFVAANPVSYTSALLQLSLEVLQTILTDPKRAAVATEKIGCSALKHVSDSNLLAIIHNWRGQAGGKEEEKKDHLRDNIVTCCFSHGILDFFFSPLFLRWRKKRFRGFSLPSQTWSLAGMGGQEISSVREREKSIEVI